MIRAPDKVVHDYEQERPSLLVSVQELKLLSNYY